MHTGKDDEDEDEDEDEDDDDFVPTRLLCGNHVCVKGSAETSEDPESSSSHDAKQERALDALQSFHGN